MIVHDITDPYFSEVVRGVEDAASPAGFLVITCSSERDAERERSYVRLLRSMRAAVVIFAGSGLADAELEEDLARHLAAMRAEGAAVVHLSPHAGGEPEVGVDNAAGIATMVEALVAPRATGGSRSSPARGPCTSPGRASPGTARAGRGRASSPTSAWSSRTSFDREGGALAVDELLAAGADVTAIACANDLLALGAMTRLAELGIRVPDDVSRRRVRRHLRRRRSRPRACPPSGSRSATSAAAASRSRT